MPLPVFQKKLFQYKATRRRCCVFVRMVLQPGKHQQPERSYEMKISKTYLIYRMVTLQCIQYQTSHNNALDGLILLLVMQGYKANAKTPTAAFLFDIWAILNFEGEDQRMQKT